MPTTIADLAGASDIELDAALQIGLNQFAAAKTAHDDPAQAETHAAITAILAEQGRRLDGSLDHTLRLS